MPLYPPAQPLGGREVVRTADKDTRSQALTASATTTVTTEPVDRYQAVTWRLTLVRSTGETVHRLVTATHNGTAAADATTTAVASHGVGSHSEITAIDATLSGTGASQVLQLQVTLGAVGGGATWTAYASRQYHEAATP